MAEKLRPVHRFAWDERLGPHGSGVLRTARLEKLVQNSQLTGAPSTKVFFRLGTLIWKFDLEFLTNFRPQKHQDRSETSDTELSISPTRPTRIHKVLHDLPWHGPPTGRKTGITTSNTTNCDNLLQIYCNLLHLHSHSGLTIHVCRIWAIFNFDCVFWKTAFAFFSLHFTS